MYAAPQTPDGRITAVRSGSGARLEIDVAFRVPAELRRHVEGREESLIFAARSRLARLGIDVAPMSELAWDGDVLGLTATVAAGVRAYGVEEFLPDVLLPGARVGRLVFCPPDRRLSSDAIDRALTANELQLPAAYSIDQDGRFFIRPEGWIYDLAEPLTLGTLKSIVHRADGKDVLNALQVRRAVDRIVLEPGDGVVTSCSMFLHRHYVVLESDDSTLGRHLEAVCLDPIRTRGTNIFLEFVNYGERRIVNPAVTAALFRAIKVDREPRRWFRGVDLPALHVDDDAPGEAEYRRLAGVFDRLEASCEESRYSHRLVAVSEDVASLVAGNEPDLVWRCPSPADQPALGADVSAREGVDAIEETARREFGTRILDAVPAGAGATVLVGYFPNLVEHSQICSAAMAGKIRTLVFRRASFEHGAFFSSRDHGRLADYEALGIDLFWCNDERRHVVTHVFRGLRGYFMQPEIVERFRASLIFAVYGSTKPLADAEAAKVTRLLTNLRSFFGEDIAILTGGGPGAMQQATEIAQSMDMLVGASFIETVDQETNQTAAFYQTFQGRSRQARQRWFEVASFHLFFMGGVGTLEEVGLTLTDMKLGVIELSPLVFFGRYDGSRYWQSLRRQLETMVKAGRAPAWLDHYTLMTDDADAVPAFYKRVLELG